MQGPLHMPKMQPQLTNRNTPMSSPPKINPEQQEATLALVQATDTSGCPWSPACCIPLPSTHSILSQIPRKRCCLVTQSWGLHIWLFWIQRRHTFKLAENPARNVLPTALSFWSSLDSDLTDCAGNGSLEWCGKEKVQLGWSTLPMSILHAGTNELEAAAHCETSWYLSICSFVPPFWKPETAQHLS